MTNRLTFILICDDNDVPWTLNNECFFRSPFNNGCFEYLVNGD